MDGQVMPAVKPFGLRSLLLLVLVVLAGLVAMHGLGPAPVPAAAHAAAASPHAPAAGHERTAASGVLCRDGCVHADDPAGSGGHAEHADATCAVTGTAGSPALTALAVLPGHAEARAILAHGVTPGATACGRAPPTLSELQLLRI
ncbi:DUF6153 family protein [Streptomyces bobili]|uniref:DUF6153 family protein n=1 Tax=Streptomyces bobili TaxID=67280 RepID=UPI0034346C18